MKTKLLLKLTGLCILLIPIISIAQVQIGQDIDGETTGDHSGSSISMSSDGSIIASGAILNDDNGYKSGHVRVYENINGIWTQIGQDIDGETAEDISGYSVSLSSDGSIVAIGAPFNNGNGYKSGHVRVYENISGTWTQIGQDIDGEAANDESGHSVSISSDGSIVAIGAPYNNGNEYDSGHVRIYKNVSGTWTQIGQDIDGEIIADVSGVSVSLSSNGELVGIGAIHNDGNGYLSGHVRVFENISGTWTQIGQDIDGEAVGDLSGSSIKLSSDGSIVAIGTYHNDGNGDLSGHVRVFENISGTWTQIGQDIDGEAIFDLSGFSVSISSDGSIVAIGAVHNNGNGTKSGHVRVYQNLSGTWTLMGQDIDGEAANDESGRSVSLSSNGAILTIGATNNDGNGEDSGHIRIFDLSNVLSVDRYVSKSISIYPNPVENILSIALEDTIEKVEVFTILGQKIIEHTTTPLDVSNLSNGIYILKVHTQNGEIGVKRFVKE